MQGSATVVTAVVMSTTSADIDVSVFVDMGTAVASTVVVDINVCRLVHVNMTIVS